MRSSFFLFAGVCLPRWLSTGIKELGSPFKTAFLTNLSELVGITIVAMKNPLHTVMGSPSFVMLHLMVDVLIRLPVSRRSSIGALDLDLFFGITVNVDRNQSRRCSCDIDQYSLFKRPISACVNFSGHLHRHNGNISIGGWADKSRWILSLSSLTRLFLAGGSPSLWPSSVLFCWINVLIEINIRT